MIFFWLYSEMMRNISLIVSLFFLLYMKLRVDFYTIDFLRFFIHNIKILDK